MRSPRGYLDTLVRSARPAAAAGVHAVRQPDWGPTRLPDPADEAEPVGPAAPQPAPRARARSPRPAAPPTVRPLADTTDASPPAIGETALPRHPRPPAPVAVTRVEQGAPLERGPSHRTAQPSVVRERPAAPPPPPDPPERRAPPPPAPVVPREIVTPAPPRLPAGTEAALQRLEHLARRFSAARPVDADGPPPAPEKQPRLEAPPAHAERRAEPSPIAHAAAPRTPTGPGPGPARVEIGSIEVFVTQPPSPGPVAASVAPARAVVAAPARPERLSRPLHPYGFGQG